MTGATSIGIDLVDVKRIRRALDEHGERFLDRLLGPEERPLMEPRRDRAQFIAGRFAAKEAAIKALGKYITTRPAFGALQVLPDGDGRPQLIIADKFLRQLPRLDIQVSISHEREYAVAIVLFTEMA